MTQQLTKDDLRGCPFCGGLGEIEEIESGCYGVGCQDCDFQLMNGSIGLGWHKSESDAVRTWNERNSDLCIQGLQDWTKKLQSSLDAANKRIAELEQGKCLHQIAEPAAPHAARDLGLAALEQYLKECEENQIVADVGGAFAYAWQRAAAPQAVQATVAVDAVTDLKNALADATELRQKLRLMEEHARGDVWRWQADAANELASMGNRMGVLIHASDLRNLLAAAAHPAEGVPAPVAAGEHEDMQDMVSKALTTAWQLGQTFWRQADSVRHTMHAKSEQTERDFEALIENTRAALAATQPAAQGMDAQQYRIIDHGELIQAGDEFLRDDFTWQIDPEGIFVGTRYGIALRPARRAIAAQAKQGGA